MSNPLLIPAEIEFEKVAYATRLDDDPEDWPTAILKESYKQLPFLQSLEIDVELERVDSARGYAVGKMLVYPAGLQKEAAAEAKKLISVPVIVRDREMSPLDVYSHDGKMYPMDEDKVTTLMHRPETFGRLALRNEFKGTNIHAQMTPPNTDHQYNAGTLHKTGSVRDLWKMVSSTITKLAVAGFKEKLRGDIPLRESMLRSDSTRDFLEGLFAVKEKTAGDMRTARLGSLRPSVTQIRRAGKDYIFKTASHACYVPAEIKVSRFETRDALSESSWGRLLKDDYVTLTHSPVNLEQMSEKRANVAERVGAYRVYAAGKEIEGIVIPAMVNLDGDAMSSHMFISEDAHAIQEKVAGVWCGGLQFPHNEPRGRGVFVYQVGPRAIATEPIEVTNRVDIDYGTEKIASFLATRLATGEQIKITMVPGLQKVAKDGRDVYLPDSMTFMPIWGKQVKVTSTPEDVHLFEHRKIASIDSVLVRADGTGTSFEFSGKNASAFRGQLIEQEDAEFALGAMGLTGAQSRSLLKTAAANGSARAPITRKVVTESEMGSEALVKAASVVAKIPNLAVDLAREAAVLAEHHKLASVVASKETVDAILSLGFITPENVSIYVDYLPELEKVSSKLAELLVASRLGMDEVREAAAKNAMTQINSVVKGLATLREQIQ